ncbi:MAG: DUF421 domain-containing protein [Clostridia bacterium]|nr:DUF421 domain-containing protein [Clostridia bacterium]
MITILFRTLVIYFFLILTMRFMGKRQLGELEVSELVTTLLLSEVASLPITNQDIPLAYALIPILTLMSLEVLLSGLLLEVPWLKRLLSIRPSILIRHGKPDPAAMRRSRISAEELLSQLRLKDVTDPGTVEYAIEEPNGQLSVVLKAGEKSATARDVGAMPAETGIMHLIISDGQVNEQNLSLSGHDRRWLDGLLASHGLRIGDVFLLLADDGGKVRILPRSAS